MTVELDLLALIVDPSEARPATVLELSGDESLEEAVAAMTTALEAVPSAEHVGLSAAGTFRGVVERRRLEEVRSRVPRLVGAGEGDTMPGGGEPRYQALIFECDQCSRVTVRVHADGGAPQCDDHGAMQMRR